jgi:hypothetical protein
MQYVRQAKLGKINRKTTQIKNKNGFFLIGRQKCSPIIVLKQPIDQFRLLSQKMPKIAILYGQNGKVWVRKTAPLLHKKASQYTSQCD